MIFRFMNVQYWYLELFRKYHLFHTTINVPDFIKHISIPLLEK